MLIIQVYAPTCDKTEEEIDELYRVVEETTRENKEYYNYSDGGLE